MDVNLPDTNGFDVLGSAKTYAVRRRSGGDSDHRGPLVEVS
jgi:hypothetical protein